MKLLYEEHSANFEIEESFNESTNSISKKYKIKGIFSTPGQRNKNGRIYPMSIWESQVNKYQDELKNGTSNCLMELNHPPRTNVDMMEAVAKIEKLYIKDGYVMGEAFLLNNPKANQLKSLIDAGITMAVSSRGVGSVGRDNLVEKFNLITFDLIPDQGQSDYNAKMMGIVEGVLEDKEFQINENGTIEEIAICTNNICHMFEKKDVQAAFMSKFTDLLSEMLDGKVQPSNVKSKSGKHSVKVKLKSKNKGTLKEETTTKFFSSKEEAEKYADLNDCEILSIN